MFIDLCDFGDIIPTIIDGTRYEYVNQYLFIYLLKRLRLSVSSSAQQ